MAATKKTTKTKSAPKKKRPTFSAPTPPDPDKEKEEVVQNVDEEVIENTADTTPEAEPAKPTPPSKMITKEGPDKEASFDQIIKDEQSEEEPEDTEDDVVEVELEDDTVEATDDLDSEYIEESDEKGGSMFKKFLILILILIAIAGWAMFFITKYPDMFGGVSVPGGSTEPSPSPTEAPSAPSPTPVDKSVIIIEVLNGAGISGAAGTTADTLEGMGYTIADTGNADNSDYTATEIYTTSDFPDELTAIFLLDLKEEYGVASISGTIDELENDANTQIILGTDWFEDETDEEEDTSEEEA